MTLNKPTGDVGMRRVAAADYFGERSMEQEKVGIAQKHVRLHG